MKKYVQCRNKCHGTVIAFGKCSSNNRPRNTLERERHVISICLRTLEVPERHSIVGSVPNLATEV
jgi:hypothetical protein